MPHIVHHQIAAFECEPIQDTAQRLEVSLGSPVLVLLSLKAERHGVPDLNVIKRGGGAKLVVVSYIVPRVVALTLGVLGEVVEVSLLLVADLFVLGSYDSRALEFPYLRLKCLLCLRPCGERFRVLLARCIPPDELINVARLLVLDLRCFNVRPSVSACGLHSLSLFCPSFVPLF